MKYNMEEFLYTVGIAPQMILAEYACCLIMCIVLGSGNISPFVGFCTVLTEVKQGRVGKPLVIAGVLSLAIYHESKALTF